MTACLEAFLPLQMPLVCLIDCSMRRHASFCGMPSQQEAYLEAGQAGQLGEKAGEQEEEEEAGEQEEEEPGQQEEEEEEEAGQQEQEEEAGQQEEDAAQQEKEVAG